jgi:hypothetical protein
MCTYTIVRYIPAVDPVRFTTVITTHSNNNTPHLEILLKNNRDTEVYILSDNRDIIGIGADTKCLFHNAITVDVLLRDWWRDNKNKVLTKKILLLEYDVLLTIPVHDDMFTDGIMTTTRFGAYNELPPEQSWESGTWWWQYHGDKLPYELKCKATQTFCVALWLNSQFLDLLISSEWDQLYQEIIVNEIRIPTIANFYNIPLYNWDNKYGISQTSCQDPTMLVDEEKYSNIKNLVPGVYHQVKTHVDIFQR